MAAAFASFDYSDLLAQRYDDEHDCYWLVQEIARRAGRFLPDVARPEDPRSIYSLIARHEPVAERIDKPELYAVVTFRGNAQHAHHIGIVFPDARHFAHILEGRQTMISELRLWKPRIVSFYRLRTCP